MAMGCDLGGPEASRTNIALWCGGGADKWCGAAYAPFVENQVVGLVIAPSTPDQQPIASHTYTQLV